MKSDLISIIIPVYNVEKYLNKCIESVVKQTYKNLEIILIDDGSTDSSGRICDKWAQADERIKVIHKENRGVSSARNVGLDIAQGEYIGFVDSDDYIHSKMYEIMINDIKNNKEVDGVFCNIYAVSKNDNIEKPQLKYNNINTNIEIMQEYFRANNRNGVLWNKLIKHKCIENIRFDEKISNSEDEVFYFEVLNIANKILFEQEYLYYHLARENSAIYETNIDKKKSSLDAKIKMNKILEQNNIEQRFLLQCDYICSVYLYEYLADKKIDFSYYKNIAQEYLKQGLLSQKLNIKNKIKVIGAVYFTPIYLALKKGK